MSVGIPSAPLAIFDFDGTLTTSDSFLPLLLSYGMRHRKTVVPRIIPELALYGVKLVSARTSKERLLKCFLAGEPLAKIRSHLMSHTLPWLKNHLNPATISLLRIHQMLGHRVIVVSASPSIYVPDLALSLGVNEVVCTRVSIQDEVCQGDIISDNCKGDVKVAMLKDYLQDELPTETWSYGDSLSDLPIINWAKNGALIKRGTVHWTKGTPPQG